MSGETSEKWTGQVNSNCDSDVWELLTAAAAALCHAGSSVWSCHFSSHSQHHSGRRKAAFFLWKAHLAGKETSIPTPPPTDLKPPINHHLCPHPLAHLLPVPPSQALEGWQGSVSGADDVTLGEVSEFRAVNRRNCLSLFTMPACQSCNSFCI